MSPFLSGTHRRAAIEEPIIVTPRSLVTYVSLLNLTLVEVAAAIIQMLLFLHELMLEFNLSLNPRFYEIETNSLRSECVGAPLSQSPFYSWIFRKTWQRCFLDYQEELFTLPNMFCKQDSKCTLPLLQNALSSKKKHWPRIQYLSTFVPLKTNTILVKVFFEFQICMAFLLRWSFSWGGRGGLEIERGSSLFSLLLF